MSLLSDLQRNRAVYALLTAVRQEPQQAGEPAGLPQQAPWPEAMREVKSMPIETQDILRMPDRPQRTLPTVAMGGETFSLAPLRGGQERSKLGQVPMYEAQPVAYPQTGTPQPVCTEQMDVLAQLEQRMESDARRFSQDFAAEEGNE